MQIEISEAWPRFILEYEAYQKVWLAYAIDRVGEKDYWFKGRGATQVEAVTHLHSLIANGQHVGKPLERATWNKDSFVKYSHPPKTDGIDLDKLEISI